VQYPQRKEKEAHRVFKAPSALRFIDAKGTQEGRKEGKKRV